MEPGVEPRQSGSGAGIFNCRVFTLRLPDSSQPPVPGGLQSCPTLCDPVDCSPPGSSVRGTLQARKQEWAAMLFSKGSSDPGVCLLHFLHRQADSLPLSYLGSCLPVNSLHFLEWIPDGCFWPVTFSTTHGNCDDQRTLARPHTLLP